MSICKSEVTSKSVKSSDDDESFVVLDRSCSESNATTSSSNNISISPTSDFFNSKEFSEISKLDASPISNKSSSDNEKHSSCPNDVLTTSALYEEIYQILLYLFEKNATTQGTSESSTTSERINLSKDLLSAWSSELEKAISHMKTSSTECNILPELNSNNYGEIIKIETLQRIRQQLENHRLEGSPNANLSTEKFDMDQINYIKRCSKEQEILLHYLNLEGEKLKNMQGIQNTTMKEITSCIDMIQDLRSKWQKAVAEAEMQRSSVIMKNCTSQTSSNNLCSDLSSNNISVEDYEQIRIQLMESQKVITHYEHELSKIKSKLSEQQIEINKLQCASKMNVSVNNNETSGKTSINPDNYNCESKMKQNSEVYRNNLDNATTLQHPATNYSNIPNNGKLKASPTSSYLKMMLYYCPKCHAGFQEIEMLKRHLNLCVT